ncbi:C-GCAxxG-C-C family protein [Deltaproteobacteria bacterium OttesenSCG-928-K17]|nr:C-GCAxxG-C-C family protein [Deltaproteobacteria bacterium OttesenSCG-928-K17]
MIDDTQMMVMELAGQGYSCAQIVIIGALRLLGRENPDLVRAAGALANGASCGELCGALTGGLCFLSLHTGKGLDDERPVPGAKTLAGALIKWFTREELRGEVRPTCRAIFESAGLDASSGEMNPAAGCGDLVAHTWNKAVEILQDNNIDPTEGRPEA